MALVDSQSGEQNSEPGAHKIRRLNARPIKLSRQHLGRIHGLLLPRDWAHVTLCHGGACQSKYVALIFLFVILRRLVAM